MDETIDAPIEGLTEKQSRAFWLSFAGETDVSIAAQLEIARTTVWRWRSLPAWSGAESALKAYRRAAAKAVLEAGAQRAAQRIAEIVDSADEAVALRAAAEVLDRSGVGRTTHQEVDVTHHGAADLDTVDPAALDAAIASID